MTDPTPNALTWSGRTIGGAGSHIILDEGIEGLGGPPIRMAFTERKGGDGSWGGLATRGERAIGASGWFDGDGDSSEFFLWEAAMDARPSPYDELPLTWSGLMYPSSHAIWCRPSKCDWLIDEDAVEGGAPGIDLQWVASDPTIYRLDAQHETFGTDELGGPVTSHTYDVVNEGLKPATMPRSLKFRLTAHGTVVAPWIRVEHLDGTVEEVLWFTTLTGGQVLTVDEWRTSRVGTAPAGGWLRSRNEAGVWSRAPLWPRWLPNPVPFAEEPTLHVNKVTIGASSGTFSGFLETRST